jgi:hypothetical protein
MSMPRHATASHTPCFLQVYLGGFGQEDLAALAYDFAAVHARGAAADLNFPLSFFAPERAVADQAGCQLQLPVP